VKDDDIGKQRKLLVNLANISKKVNNMSTIFELLTTNLKEAEK